MRDPDPYALYTIVRRSLNLTAGKVGAQCQHALDYLTRAAENGEAPPTFYEWHNTDDHAKIVLGATDEEFEAVKREHPAHFHVIDHGYTQVAPNTETCMCLWPMRKSQRSKLLKSLRPL